MSPETEARTGEEEVEAGGGSPPPAAEVRAAPDEEGDVAVDVEEDPATRLARDVEAILFTADVPLDARRIARMLGAPRADVVEAIDALNVFYAESRRAFRVQPLAGGFQLVTLPEHAKLLGRLHRERVPTRLSRAALETLSIIAFKQPVTRAEIDGIRGVSASDRVLRLLIERKLVRISGRADAPGRPLLYGTTREFLGRFGLSSVADLPRTDELAALLAGEIPDAEALEHDSPEAARLAEAFPEEEDSPPGAGAVMMEGGPAAPRPGDPLPDEVSHSGEESDEHEGEPAPPPE